MKTKSSDLRASGIKKWILLCAGITVFVMIALQSCEKQQSPLTATVQQQSASTALAGTAAVITKEQALERLNQHFKNEFSTITMQQVYGVSRAQFTKWLRNSKMAPAEQLYLSPLLDAGGQEYVILKNVLVKATGKYANVGLIATTPPFFPQFTRMVAVVNYQNIVIGNKKICSWKRCDSYSPCPCITWIDFVTGECPSDKCIDNYDCRGFDAGDCNGELTGITTYDVISAF